MSTCFSCLGHSLSKHVSFGPLVVSQGICIKFILLTKSKSLEHTFPMVFCGVRQKKKCICDAKEEKSALSVLHKPNGGRLLAETLTAQIEAILANETCLVCAEATLARSLSILTRARKPNSVVSHVL